MASKKPMQYIPREERPEFLALVAELMNVLPEQFPDIARQCAEQYHDAVLAGHVEVLDQMEMAYTALVYQLNGGTLQGCAADDSRSARVLARALAARPGQVPCWGQAGEFLLEVDGLRLRVVLTPDMLGNHHGCALHAVDLDRPFISAEGFRAAMLTVTSCLGETVDQAARRLVLELLQAEGGAKPIAANAWARTQPQKAPGWLADALAGVRPDGQLAMFGDAPHDPNAKVALSNAERQRALRKRRKEQQLKPVMLSEAERQQLERWREQGTGQDDEHSRSILLTHTDRCVLSLGLLAHEDLDHRPRDWEVSKKPGFDVLLRKLWPEGDNGRYLAEPERSTRRPAGRLRERIEGLERQVAGLQGVVRRNPRNFRQPSSSPATSASRSMNLPSVWKV